MHSLLQQSNHCVCPMCQGSSEWQGHSSEFIVWSFEVYPHWERQEKTYKETNSQEKKVKVQPVDRRILVRDIGLCKGVEAGRAWLNLRPVHRWRDSTEHGGEIGEAGETESRGCPARQGSFLSQKPNQRDEMEEGLCGKVWVLAENDLALEKSEPRLKTSYCKYRISLCGKEHS